MIFHARSWNNTWKVRYADGGTADQDEGTIDGGVDGDGSGADEEDAEAGKLCKYWPCQAFESARAAKPHETDSQILVSTETALSHNSNSSPSPAIVIPCVRDHRHHF